MKYFLFVSGFMFWMTAWSQVLTVTDDVTGEPLQLVTLMSQQPQVFAMSNSRGQVDITPFKGAQQIDIRLLGYQTQVMSYSDLVATGLKLRMTATSINMDAVVVSAARWNQVATDIPSRVIHLSAKELALQNPQTAADLLAISGKVFIQKSQQGGGSPMIRGFATNRLVYAVDGVRMNTAIFRGGNLQNVISLDPFATEKTEVFFGPGSVIYGSDAIGGVMSFQTLTPQLSLSGQPLVKANAVSRFSTANHEITGHLDVGVGWKKWAVLTSFSRHQFSDLKMGKHGPEEYLRPFFVERQGETDVVVPNSNPRVQRPSGYDQLNLMQKVRFQPSAAWDVQYGFHHSQTSSYSRYDRHIRYRNGQPRYGEWDYGPQQWTMNLLSVTHSGKRQLYDQFSARVAHQLFGESRIDRDIHDPIRHIREERVSAVSANADFTKRVNEKLQFYYGAEWVLDEVASKGTEENVETGAVWRGPARYPQATWASAGVYTTAQFRPAEKWLISGGIRYNRIGMQAHFDTAFYDFPFTEAVLNKGALTGSLGAVHQPGGSWVLSANLATAFRAPNVDDLGKVFDSEAGAVTVPNPDLRPEYAWNADLGLTKVINQQWKLDGSAYYTYLDHALVRRNFTLGGADSIWYDGTFSQVQAIQNAARATVMGIQVGSVLTLPAGWEWSADVNLQKGEEELDDGSLSPSRHAPPWFGVSRIRYTHQSLEVLFYTHFSGRRTFAQLPQEERGKPEIYAADDQGNPWSPGWHTLNVKTQYRFSDHLLVTAGAENLTNQRYRPYSSGIVAPGFNLVFSVRASI